MSRVIEEEEKMPEAEAWADAAERRAGEALETLRELEGEDTSPEDLLRARVKLNTELETVVTHGTPDQVARARETLKDLQVEHLARGVREVLEVKRELDADEGEPYAGPELIAERLYEKLEPANRWGHRRGA